MERQDVIVQTPDICFGKPVIKGTRVPVAALVSALASGDPIGQVAEDYGVKVSEVFAALRFALRQVVRLTEALREFPLTIVAEKFGDEKLALALRFLLRLRGPFRSRIHRVMEEAHDLLAHLERDEWRDGHPIARKTLLLFAAQLTEVPDKRFALEGFPDRG
jgi:uncharacterized protein (DUF433 family)